MQVDFQVCCLVIMLLLFVIYVSHKRLKICSETVFFKAIVITIAMLVLDIAAVAVIYYMDYLKLGFVEWICRLYLMSLLWATGMLPIYVLSDVLPRKRFLRFNKFFELAIFLECILIAILPIRIDKLLYSHGVAVYAVYGIAVIHFLMALFSIVKFKDHMSKRRALGVLLWIGVWTAFALVQFFIPNLLIVGFAVTLGVIILFALLESPEAKLDRRFGCFNFYTLKMYVSALYDDNAEFCVLAIYFRNITQLSEVALGKSTKLLLNIVNRYSSVKIFKNVNWEFVCIAENQSQINALTGELLGALEQSNNEMEDMVLVRCLNAEQLHDQFELSQTCRFAKDMVSENSRFKDISDGFIEAFHRRKFVENELKLALLENRVEIFLQPIYSTIDQAVTTAEVLARIRLSDGSLLMPAEFWHVAETCGKVHELGGIVFKETCKFLSENPGLVSELGVNVSPEQLKDEGFAKNLIFMMEYYGVPSERIVLEMQEIIPSETQLVQMKNIDVLHRKGIRFGLDNFGKNEINLLRLAELRIKFVKFDIEMCKLFFRDSRYAHVVSALKKMSNDLNFRTVAVGIESEKEFKGMLGERVDYIQGFYLSKALSPLDFVAYMNAQ